MANVQKGTDDDDILKGSKRNDKIYGLKGRDLLKGNAGEDVLIGYGGSRSEVDILVGNSVGNEFPGEKDTFALGNGRKVFYTKSNVKDFAIMLGTDWEPGTDKILVNGNSEDYQILFEDLSGEVGSYFDNSRKELDTGIFYKGELIGILIDSTDVKISRDFRST